MPGSAYAGSALLLRALAVGIALVHAIFIAPESAWRIVELRQFWMPTRRQRGNRIGGTAVSMHGVIRQYKIDPEQIGAIVRHCREPFLPMLSKTLGFVSWTLMDAGPNLITASIFEDELEADNAAGWYKENQAALALGRPRVTVGPIVIHHVAEHVPAGYGLFWSCTFTAAGAAQATQSLCDNLLPEIGRMPEFASYEALDAGGGNVMSLCAFKNREAADAANRRTKDWVIESLSGLVSGAPEIELAEIMLRASKVATSAN